MEEEFTKLNNAMERLSVQLDEGFAKLNTGMDRNLKTIDKLLATYKPPVMKTLHPISFSMVKHVDGHWNVLLNVERVCTLYFGVPDMNITFMMDRIFELCHGAFSRLPTTGVYYISECDTADSGMDHIQETLDEFLQELGILYPHNHGRSNPI